MKIAQTRYCKRTYGFTVIELVIALSILIVVGAMTAIIFRSTQKSFLDAKAFQHVIELARQTTARMHNEIQGMFIHSSGKAGCLGVDATQTKIKSSSKEDELFFIAPDKSVASGAVAEIGYWQNDDGNLMRHFHHPPDFDFTTGEDSKLGLIISGLNFEFYDGSAYQESWDSLAGANKGEFPKAIRFSYLVSDRGEVVQKKFQSVVYIAASGR